jgi:hypothetical protein
MSRLTRLFALPLAAFACTGTARAEEEKLELPKVSSFNSERIARDPFERIDAKSLADQNSVVAAAGAADGDLSSLFRVSAIVIDRLAIAVINRKAFAENESFTVKTADKQMKVRVRRVRDGSVELDCDGKLITVPVVKQLPKLLLDEAER